MTTPSDGQAVPFVLACAYCDADSPETRQEAIQQGWIDIERHDGFSWNFLGICPSCRLSWEADLALLNTSESNQLQRRTIVAKSEANKPVHEIRMGRVKAAIWENEIQGGGIRHNVTVQRIYKDDQQIWQTTDSFGRDDLPLLAKVVDQAHTWIYQNGNSQGS